MSTVSIDVKNAFIANFMGYKRVTVGYSGSEEETEWQRNNEQWMNKVGITMVGDYYVDVDNDEWVHCEDVNYDKSWDALMPVVEKIETVDVNEGRLFRSAADVKIMYKACIIEYLPDEDSGDPCEEEITIQTQGESKLAATHDAVYQFITWYNSQKP
jgi:hypothetical protein